VTLYRALGREQGDRLLQSLPAAGLVVYLAAMYVPIVAAFFEMEPLSAGRWCWVVGVVALASGVAWLMDRIMGHSHEARR